MSDNLSKTEFEVTPRSTGNDLIKGHIYNAWTFDDDEEGLIFIAIGEDIKAITPEEALAHHFIGYAHIKESSERDFDLEGGTRVKYYIESNGKSERTYVVFIRGQMIEFQKEEFQKIFSITHKSNPPHATRHKPIAPSLFSGDFDRMEENLFLESFSAGRKGKTGNSSMLKYVLSSDSELKEWGGLDFFYKRCFAFCAGIIGNRVAVLQDYEMRHIHEGQNHGYKPNAKMVITITYISSYWEGE